MSPPQAAYWPLEQTRSSSCGTWLQWCPDKLDWSIHPKFIHQMKALLQLTEKSWIWNIFRTGNSRPATNYYFNCRLLCRSFSQIVAWSIKCQKIVKNVDRGFSKPKVRSCFVRNLKIFSLLKSEKSAIDRLLNYLANNRIVDNQLIDWIVTALLESL